MVYGSGSGDQVTSPSTGSTKWRLLTKSFPCEAATVLKGDLSHGAYVAIRAISGTSSVHRVELTRK